MPDAEEVFQNPAATFDRMSEVTAKLEFRLKEEYCLELFT